MSVYVSSQSLVHSEKELEFVLIFILTETLSLVLQGKRRIKKREDIVIL